MHGLLNGWCKRLTLEGLFRLKEGFDERVDIRFGVITRERNADRAVDDGGGKMQSLEHMAAVALGAGGTGGDVDFFCLQALDDAPENAWLCVQCAGEFEDAGELDENSIVAEEIR